jgi:hypothetical protein
LIQIKVYEQEYVAAFADEKNSAVFAGEKNSNI